MVILGILIGTILGRQSDFQSQHLSRDSVPIGKGGRVNSIDLQKGGCGGY